MVNIPTAGTDVVEAQSHGLFQLQNWSQRQTSSAAHWTAIFRERASAQIQFSSYICFVTFLSFSFILRENLKNRCWTKAHEYVGTEADSLFSNTWCISFSFALQKFFTPQCFYPPGKQQQQQQKVFPWTTAVTAPTVLQEPLVSLFYKVQWLFLGTRLLEKCSS